MRIQNLVFRIGALGLPLLLPATLHAQFGLAARASTLGIGAEVSYRLSPMVGFRVGGNYLEFSRDATIEDIDYHLTPHFENGSAIVDLFPMGGALHISGGLLINDNEGRMVARLNHDIEIGGTTYTPDQVGSLIGAVNFRKTAPYLGLGLAGRGKVAVLFDLGVGFTGTPRASLAGLTPLTGSAKAQFDANVADELAQIQAEIDGKSYLKFHPVVSVGFKIGF